MSSASVAKADDLPVFRTYPIVSIAGEPSADLRDDLLGEALESIVGTLQGELVTAFGSCFEFPPIQDVIEVHVEFDPGSELSGSFELPEEVSADFLLILRLTVDDDEVQWTARVYEMSGSGPSMKVFVQEPRSYLGFYKRYIGTEGRRLLQEKLTGGLIEEVGRVVDCDRSAVEPERERTDDTRPALEEEMPRQLAGKTVTLPRGFRWGMSYEDAASHAKSRLNTELPEDWRGLECRGERDADKWLDDCPDGWRRRRLGWPPVLGHDLDATLFFDGRDTIQGFYLEKYFITGGYKSGEIQKRLNDLYFGLVSELTSRYGPPQRAVELRNVAPPVGQTVDTIWNGPGGGTIRIQVKGYVYDGMKGHAVRLWYGSEVFTAEAAASALDQF